MNALVDINNSLLKFSAPEVHVNNLIEMVVRTVLNPVRIALKRMYTKTSNDFILIADSDCNYVYPVAKANYWGLRATDSIRGGWLT
jgi:urate oxidase